jgi:hypothetical protein
MSHTETQRNRKTELGRREGEEGEKEEKLKREANTLHRHQTLMMIRLPSSPPPPPLPLLQTSSTLLLVA